MTEHTHTHSIHSSPHMQNMSQNPLPCGVNEWLANDRKEKENDSSLLISVIKFQLICPTMS